MSWIRQGVVALTNGSKAVAGTGTQWQGNVRNGDTFYTPAGPYEVDSVTDDDTLQLVDAYAGPTASNVAYKIAPTQGHLISVAKQQSQLMADLGALKDAYLAGDLVAAEDLTVKIDAAVLALSGGAAKVGWSRPEAGSTARKVSDKLNEIVSIRDKGAKVDGTTDDSAAIASARAVISGTGGRVHFGGKTLATDYWGNLSPLVDEWQKGAPDDYHSDFKATKPLTSHKIFTATPQTGGGFAAYAHRVDVYTKAGVDVASTVGFASIMNVLSTNSGGGPTTNNTNQVAGVFSAAAQSTTASAPVTGLNVLASSAYTGTIWQPVVGIEVDIDVANEPGFYGQTARSTGIAYSAILSSHSPKNATAGFAVDTSKPGGGYLFGVYAAGVVSAGVVVTRNTVTPDTAFWAAAAGTYGIYVGPKPLYDLGPGKGPAYDANHNPVIGIALGQIAATNGRSHKLRFAETNGAGGELTTDIYRSGTVLTFEMNGANVFGVASSGAVLVGGQQVLSSRKTGYATLGGTLDRSTALNTESASLVQLARRVAALQADLSSHGLIGA